MKRYEGSIGFITNFTFRSIFIPVKTILGRHNIVPVFMYYYQYPFTNVALIVFRSALSSVFLPVAGASYQ